MIRHTRHIPKWRILFTPLVLLLMVLLSACGSVAGLGPEPTAQAVAAAAGEFSPTILLSPSSGYAGTNVFVIGTGWPTNLSVVVLLTDPNGISTTVASTSTDGAGNLKTDFFYPSDARWLLNAPYTVSVASADATYQAAAKFTVANPADAPTPTTVPTTVPTDVPTTVLTTAPTAIAQTPTVAPTATPLPTATPVPTTVPTSVPQATASPTSQAQPANATPASNTAFVTAALVPIENHRSSHDRYVVEIKPSGNVTNVVAVILIPPLAEIDDVKLKERARLDIKVDPGKLEINAPDPEKMLAFIEEYGGIPVAHGQEVEFKRGPEHRFRARVNGDTLTVDAPSLLLQVTVIDAAGKPHQVTVSPTGPSPDSNNGRDDDDNEDNRDDDDEEDDDDSGNDNNGKSNGKGNGKDRGNGNGNRGRGNNG